MPLLRSYAEARSVSYQDIFSKGGEWFGGVTTSSGRKVDRSTALKFSTVYACVSLVSEVWASLPVGQYRKIADGRVPVDDDELALWLDDPTGLGDNVFNLPEAIAVSLMLGGNYYAEVLTAPRTGEPIAVQPLDYQRVTPVRLDDGSTGFDVMLDSGVVVTAQRYRRGMTSGVLHIPGLRLAGSLAGLAPLELAREAVGLGLTAEEFGAAFFANGSRPDVVIELPEGTKADSAVMDRLRKGWTDRHQGPTKRHRPGVLSDGAKLKEISIAPDHAQFLETREFQRSDVASWFRCPPHMVGIVSKSTSWGSGIEEQSIGFGRYTLTPHVTRAERGLRSLLPQPTGARQFVKWNLGGLERSTLLSRYQAYAIGRAGGWLNTNDIRRGEDMAPLEGPAGTEYIVPLNMTPADLLALSAGMGDNGGDSDNNQPEQDGEQ